MSKRKRKRNHFRPLQNERDRNGWRIPREGTLSRKIYDAIRDGERPVDIAKALRVDVANVNVLAHRFRNPEWAKAQRRRRKEQEEEANA